MRASLLVFFALLPLQWFALGSTPLGTGRLHQVAILAFAAFLFMRYRLRSHAPVLRLAAPFVVANIYMLTIWAAVDLYNGKVPTGPVQVSLYLGAAVVIGTHFYLIASERQPGLVDVLRWAAAAAVGSLIIGFTIAMLVNGVNPLAVLGKTIAAADPQIFQQEVFKSSFAGFGLDAEQVQGNLRHEIFGSVLLSMAVSTWAMRFGGPASTAERIGYRTSMALGAVLLVVSLSRSIVIAALVWPLIACGRAIVMHRLSPRQLALTASVAIAVALLAVTGFGAVIWNRFTTDTTGINARADNYFGAFSELKDHWLTGGFEAGALGVSSHNFILDNWLRGGIFTALPAAAILVMTVLLWLRLVVQLPRQPDWMVPVTAALALPIVRMGTSGGGLIPPIEWVALAFVAGVLVMAAQRSVAARTPGPVEVPTATSLA